MAPQIPGVLEQALPVGDDGAAHGEHDIVPVPRLGGGELVGDAGAADEGDDAVDSEQFAVVAPQIAPQCAVAQRVVVGDVDAGGDQATAIVMVQFAGAEVVQQ